MQSRAKLWLILAALGFSGCAKGALDDPEQNPAPPKTEPSEDDPYGVTPPGSAKAGSGGQAGRGGAPASLGSAGHTASASGAGGTGGIGGTGSAGSAGSAGANTALAGAGSSGSAGSAGAKPGPSDDCPSLTRVRLKSGGCVDRIKEFSVASSPTSIITGSDGQVWFDDDSVNQLVQLDSEGRVLKRIDCAAGSSPRTLVGGRDDALLWYTDAGAKTLTRMTQTSHVTFDLKFTATAITLGEGDLLWLAEAGQALYQVRPYVSVTPFALSPSNAVIVGPDNNVWFPTLSLIAQLIPDQEPKYFQISPSIADDLCAGPDGALWFADSRRHQIGRMDLSGNTKRFDLPYGSGPSRIIAGPDGALWFIAQSGDKIGRITVDGSSITQYPIPTTGGLPWALTVGGDRNLWFTEKDSGKVSRLIPDPQG